MPPQFVLGGPLSAVELPRAVSLASVDMSVTHPSSPVYMIGRDLSALICGQHIVRDAED